MDEQQDKTQAENEQNNPESEREKAGKLDQVVTYTDEDAMEAVNLYRKPPRLGKYVSDLSAEQAAKYQRRKSTFMYISTLLFAVSIFLPVGGRDVLLEKPSLKSVTTLYLIAVLALIVMSVYVSFKNRVGQKIGCELKASAVPRDGLDHHTFWSYEIFNALHIALALGETAIAVLSFGKYGAMDIVIGVLDILVMAGAAVCSHLSRNEFFKANANHLTFVEPTPEEIDEFNNKKSKKKNKKKKNNEQN